MDGRGAPAVERRGVEGTLAEQACPSCGARIVYDRAFVPWCTACDWNVRAGRDVDPTPSVRERMFAIAGRRARRSALDHVSAAAAGRRRLSLTRVVAYALAGLILGLSALIALTGVWLVVAGGNLVASLIGVFLLLIAYASRPRFMPPPELPVPRTAAPELYRLLDEIAAKTGAPTMPVIGLDGGWNATTYRYGFRYRRAITLGLPLWHALEPEERVALLAHEVAHNVNGDVLRSVVIVAALDTLAGWSAQLRPDRWDSGFEGQEGLFILPFNLLLAAASRALDALGAFLVFLLYRDGQRAELLADLIAARVAGTEATLACLDRLRNDAAYRRAVSSVALGERTDELWDELDHQIRITPSSEIARLRRAEELEGWRIVDSHPPISERTSFVRAQAAFAGSLQIERGRMTRIDAELEQYRRQVARETVEGYMASIQTPDVAVT